MAVTAASNDQGGAQIDLQIANIIAQIADQAASGNGAGTDFTYQLNQLQVQAVDHYMAVGRISAATILSTLS
jgi:hypothetical protein